MNLIFMGRMSLASLSSIEIYEYVFRSKSNSTITNFCSFITDQNPPSSFILNFATFKLFSLFQMQEILNSLLGVPPDSLIEMPVLCV